MNIEPDTTDDEERDPALTMGEDFFDLPADFDPKHEERDLHDGEEQEGIKP